MDRPVFVISLDLELAWGFVRHPEHEVLKLLAGDPRHGRGVMEILIGLFDKYGIPATWAAVGHLLLNSGEAKGLISREMPQFKGGWLDWEFYSRICSSPLYCAPDIVDSILASPVNHEIGLHSFFHIPFALCDEAVAREEMRLGAGLAQKWGILPKAFVFPGNYLGHIGILGDYGIEIYRGRDAGRGQEASARLVRKAGRAIDKLIAPPVEPSWRGGIQEIPGSTYFCDPHLPFTLLPRARMGLERAIRANKVFHIWLHPWNLLQQRSLAAELEKFLDFAAQKRDKGNLQVMTMGGLAACLNRSKEGCYAGSCQEISDIQN